MPNMSYCRFENTLIDLKDCIGAVEEAIEEDVAFHVFAEKLGSYELSAFDELYVKAKEFIRLVDSLSDH